MLRTINERSTRVLTHAFALRMRIEVLMTSDSLALLECGSLNGIMYFLQTLQRIADEGLDALYSEDAASKMAAEISDNDGIITADDIMSYSGMTSFSVQCDINIKRFKDSV